MEMLDKLNNLKERLNSSPENLKKFMKDYEEYRNEVIYNQMKSVFINNVAFYYLSEDNIFDKKKESSEYDNKKVDVSVNTFNLSSEIIMFSDNKFAA
ncbi:hypothetical protein [Enterococcus faecium]|uniref:hypothetical protein n=1 Tax=Enterococcus faecium TaxID=1352 RepID=UPI000DE8577A|nr:hypothetical protein [Enterococcus faecium]EJC3739886.1 hypothetical protein [Enterococcus faecium]MDG4589496.1 hypothetical protein [Enterococcus faecium]NTM12945.1 hypothetical protein [Enterococcus faecium]RBS81051.1 hypothetical protein EB51_01849 [Enterococcus faecium]VFA70458.1 Uncharacterised protein [Enterococcus faecium]